MTTFLRHRLWPAIALLLALTVVTGVAYPLRRDRRRPGRLPAPGQRLVHRDRRRPDHRLEPHRPGVQRAEVLLGPAVGGRRDRREPSATTRARRPARNLGPDEPGPDRPDHRRGRPPAGGQRRRADPGRPRHDLGVRPRSRTSAPRRPSTRSARVAAARGMSDDDVRAAVARHTEQPMLGFLGQAARQRPAAEPRPRRAAADDGLHRDEPIMSDPERDAFDVRPTADEMLARIRAETPSGRGRLRVYLGMAPGVGKTYRMLEEGHRRVARGTDLVVGFVEAHGRPRHDRAARRPRDRPAPADRVPRRRRRGDGHRRRPRAPADRRADRRAGPHERARARRGRSAGRTSRSSATPASTS